jgi:hypothetical protein
MRGKSWKKDFLYVLGVFGVGGVIVETWFLLRGIFPKSPYKVKVSYRVFKNKIKTVALFTQCGMSRRRPTKDQMGQDRLFKLELLLG